MDEALIDAVASCPAVYDKNNPNYTNRNYLNDIWRGIGDELGIGEQAAKKKWTNLRDYFQKQHKRMKLAKSTNELQTTKKWFLYDAMNFLEPFVRQRDAHDTGPPSPANLDSASALTAVSHSHSWSENSADCPQDSVTVCDEKPHVESVRAVIRRKRPRSNATPEQLYDRLSASQSFTTEMLEPVKDVSSANAASANDFRPSGCGADGSRSQNQGQGHCNMLELDEDELFCRSLIPKMRQLEGITKAECQLEVQSAILRFMKRSSAEATSSGPTSNTIRSLLTNDNHIAA